MTLTFEIPKCQSVSPRSPRLRVTTITLISHFQKGHPRLPYRRLAPALLSKHSMAYGLVSTKITQRLNRQTAPKYPATMRSALGPCENTIEVRQLTVSTRQATAKPPQNGATAHVHRPNARPPKPTPVSVFLLSALRGLSVRHSVSWAPAPTFVSLAV